MAVDASLLTGWLPTVMEGAAAAALVLAVGWRDYRWRTRRLPIIGAAAALTGLFAARVGAPALGVTDPLPLSVWVWLAVTVAALLVLAFGWTSARWRRRLTAALAAVLALLVCANDVNRFIGYYPTVGAAVADLQGLQPPGQVSLAQLNRKANSEGARTGELVGLTIPSTFSGFAHRQELVYLPPAWFRGPRHPVLPVVEMIGAEHSAPENWVRIGNAVRTSLGYAARHQGVAPILVFVDATASFRNDTECVNGPHGMAENHLVRDVPLFISATFGASRNPRDWAVVGFSMGGTCAVGLAVEHPKTFGHFVDISGDLTPNTGTKAQTIANLYGGSAAAWAAHDPLTVMARHGRYAALTGLYVDGREERLHSQQAWQLSQAGMKVQIPSQVIVLPGGHVWQFATDAFADVFPWLCTELGLTGHPLVTGHGTSLAGTLRRKPALFRPTRHRISAAGVLSRKSAQLRRPGPRPPAGRHP